ncbi:MAG: helix-turn-helix transcriptional regulator [Ilumatobacteraceae bacterium]
MTVVDDTPPIDGTAGGLPRRFLRPFLLLALARDGAAHGYELCECVRRHGLSVDLAGVYRDLRAMEQHDLVTSQWEPSDAGPDRRVYVLTDAGQETARMSAHELSTIRDRLGSALDAFSLLAERRSA